MLTIDEITTAHQLETIVPEWSRLWRDCPGATPFQSPEWLLPWWSFFGRDKLITLAMRASGRLVGLAPLFIDADRRLHLIGAGNTDYLDVIVAAGLGEVFLSQVFDNLLNKTADWDQGDFDCLPAGSPLLQKLPARLEYKVIRSNVCPVLPCPASPDAFLDSLGSKLRRNLRRSHERLARAGELVFETASERTLNEYLEGLFRLHTARWALRQRSGVVAASSVQEFHRRVAAAQLRQGRLLFYGLRFNGKLSAVLYAFGNASRAFFYLQGFDPALRRFSPGALLLEFAVTEAIRAGFREIDFLRGSEGYKYEWGARDRSIFRLFVRRAHQEGYSCGGQRAG